MAKGPGDGVEQGTFIDWFVEVGGGAAGAGLRAGFGRIVGGEEDDRDVDSAFREEGGDLEPRGAGHADIGNDAGAFRERVALKKFVGAGEAQGIHSRGPEEQAQSIANRWIVIDEQDGGGRRIRHGGDTVSESSAE